MGFAPIDALPIGYALGYVCKSGLHLTFPSAFGLLSTLLPEITCPTSAPFQIGYLHYLPRYDFRAPFG